MNTKMEGGPSIQTEIASDSEDQPEDISQSQLTGLAGLSHSFTHPTGSMYRFVALIFLCFLGFGSYFCYDNPAALQDYIKEDLNITVTQYVMLYSIYSWPNVILCFVGGFLIDSVFGIRLGTNIYMAVTLLGQICFASGVMYNIYWIMVMGRFIFGIGAESLAVAQNNYAVLWFKGKELNMVFGLALSFARIGSTVSFLVMEAIYQWVHTTYQGPQGLGIVLFLATLTCVFSLLCSIILGLMDKRRERLTRRIESTTPEVVRLTDVYDFGGKFWLLTAICVFYYIAIFPFIGLAKEFFKERFQMNSSDANYICSIVYLISGIASPVFGFMIDKVGRNVMWIVIAILITILSHSLLAFTHSNPYIGMAIMGLAYSILASSLWPLVSLVIPEYQLGTAYGVCQSIQNLGLAVFTIVAGILAEHCGYIWLEVFFISSLGVGLLATILIWIFDASTSGVLNMSPSARTDYQRRALAAEILEKEKLVAESGSYGSTSFLQPTDFHIRNRYLSRIGAQLPSHYSVAYKGLAYRALR